METNRLMLGDWVGYIGAYEDDSGEIVKLWEKPIPIKITFITPDAVQYEDEEGCYECMDYELHPIPLTAEILEKNGFEVYEQDFTSNTVYKFGWLDYMEFKEFNKYFDIGSKITKRHLGREITYIHPLMRIYFVHELQHALRLCGIEKEIEV